MKNPDRERVSRLEELPNIGKATAASLRLIGIDDPPMLIGMDPLQMYDDLCARTGQRQDPCVIDQFMSVVHFMEGGDPLPWWAFSQERKERVAKHRRMRR